jgi:hypothetical protein
LCQIGKKKVDICSTVGEGTAFTIHVEKHIEEAILSKE